MDKKYTVFVSSTFEDLKDARDLVIKTILKMGHIPIGMESFNATDEDQWNIIQRSIDICDYYIVIVAHRYGTLSGDISITEKEYDYATNRNIPRIRCVIHHDANWKPALIDKKNSRKLDLFKEKLKAKPTEFWKAIEELPGIVAITLSSQIDQAPRPGWVRGSDSSMNALNEIARLSQENSELRNLLRDSKRKLICESPSASFVFGSNASLAKIFLYIIPPSGETVLFTAEETSVTINIDNTEHFAGEIKFQNADKSHQKDLQRITVREPASVVITAKWSQKSKIQVFPCDSELNITVTLRPAGNTTPLTLKIPITTVMGKEYPTWQFSKIARLNPQNENYPLPVDP